MNSHNWLIGGCCVFLVLALCACGRQEPDADVGETSAVASRSESRANVITVAVLGDQTRFELLKRIAVTFEAETSTADGSTTVEVPYADGIYEVRAARDESATIQGRLAWQADVVILAVNAANGPMPVHREHAILARQMDVPDVAIVLTNVHLIDDVELLQLEELEMRDLLNSNDLSGDDALLLLDRAQASSLSGGQPAGGAAKIVSALAALARRRTSDVVSAAQRMPASVYLLSHSEGFAADRATTPDGEAYPDGEAVLLMRGERYPVKVIATEQLKPGITVDVEIVFEKSLLADGHVAATGVFVPDSK